MTYGSPAFIQDGVLPALEAELPDVGALRGDRPPREPKEANSLLPDEVRGLVAASFDVLELPFGAPIVRTVIGLDEQVRHPDAPPGRRLCGRRA